MINFRIVFFIVLLFFSASYANTIQLLAGGDIAWSLSIRPPSIDMEENPILDEDWRPVPLVHSSNDAFKKNLIEYDLHFSSAPIIIEKQNIKIGFLGYTQFSNRGEPAFAALNRPGVMPMDPHLIKEDVAKLRSTVDYVVISVHWGTDQSPNVSNANRTLAHELIDAGADIILGHHTPYPKGIEVYHNKVIIYSPSHVFIGHNYEEWGDNYLVRFTLDKKNWKKVEIFPISGIGKELAQPFLLSGDRAYQLLTQIKNRSSLLDTPITISNDTGIIMNFSQKVT